MRETRARAKDFSGTHHLPSSSIGGWLVLLLQLQLSPPPLPASAAGFFVFVSQMQFAAGWVAAP